MRALGIAPLDKVPHSGTCIDRLPHVRLPGPPGIIIGDNRAAPIWVVVRPGLSGAAVLASGLIRVLDDAGFGLLGIDLPAHYGSPSCRPSEKTINDLAEVYIDEFVPEDAMILLVSTSAAAGTSHSLAQRLGNRLFCNVTVNGIGAHKLGMISSLSKFIQQTFVDTTETPLTPHDLSRSLAFYGLSPVAAFGMWKFAASLVSRSSMETAGKDQIPGVVIACENDTISDPAMTWDIVNLARPAAAMMLPRGGHAFCTMSGQKARRSTSELLEFATALHRTGAITRETPIPERTEAWRSFQTNLDAISGYPFAAWRSDYAASLTAANSEGSRKWNVPTLEKVFGGGGLQPG